MADKKPAPAPKRDVVEEILFALIILVLLSTILTKLFSLFNDVNLDSNSFVGYLHEHVFPVLKLFSFGISVFSFIGILYALSKLGALNAVLHEMYHPVIAADVPYEQVKNRRWEKVLEHINSQNPNDWKFAILEADIILDELLSTMRYKGETMADKLKTVEKSDFNTLEEAWEAHKIRNMIAHEGTDFQLTEREARRVISLFERVFQEFHYI